MAEQGISVTREEVVGFVTKLRDFHSSLSDSEQAILERVLDTTRGEVGGYGMYERSGVTEETWDDLVGCLEAKVGSTPKGSGGCVRTGPGQGSRAAKGRHGSSLVSSV
jgi:hypothetical protein